MSKVLSHIIRKRFSQVNEDVATDALSYILEVSPAANNGMKKILERLIPDLSTLKFKTQETEGSIRPDMWGYEDGTPRVFIENKFWAGLTENQPVNYLKELAKYSKPTILLVVAPTPRQHTLWRELLQRLKDAGISIDPSEKTTGITHFGCTSVGPILAITSWDNMLSILEHETSQDQDTRGDLVQLRALCESADINAFSPISRAELSDQRTPSFILDLNKIWSEAASLGVTKGILDHKGTRPQSSSERIGRYTFFASPPEKESDTLPGLWIGTHLQLWKEHGTSPLWAIFPKDEFGKAEKVQEALESWATEKGIFTTVDTDGGFVVALEIPHSAEKDTVIKVILTRLSKMRQCWLNRQVSSSMPHIEK